MTTAFAVLDLQGNVLALRSRRNWGSEGFLQAIAAYDPVIVASDTNPPSKLANKLHRSFSCRLFCPKHSLTLQEKYKLTSEFRPKNAHERDALAAALKAFHSIENKVRQVKRRAQAHGKEPFLAQAAVLRGKRMSDVA